MYMYIYVYVYISDSTIAAANPPPPSGVLTYPLWMHEKRNDFLNYFKK